MNEVDLVSLEKNLSDVLNQLLIIDLDKIPKGDAYTIQTTIKIIESGIILKIIENIKESDNERSY